MGALEIRWLGQSGYILSDGITEVMIDPYLSDVVKKVAGRPRMLPAPIKPTEVKSDVIICTHNHLDHLDTDAILSMSKENILFLAPTDAKNALAECEVTNYHSFDEGESVKIGGFELTATYANHSVPAVGVLVKHSGITMYFSGDTIYDEKLKELENIDIMFICINGKLGNMNVEEAVEITKSIGPRVAVPSHYGMFMSNTEDPKRFTDRLECGFEMKFDTVYNVLEVISDV